MCSEDGQRPLRAAELEALAAERLDALRREGRALRPVCNRTRKLAAHFWGSAWMKRLALCEEGGLCLAPGRTLLRHGCVLDLQLAPGLITALVSADELCEVELRVAPLDEEKLETLRAACSGRIDSLVSLMEGKLDAAALDVLCDPDSGLLPDPADWGMSCTCADWCEPCAHAAAAVYAAGVLIDEDPSLLFALRAADPSMLLAAPAAQDTDFDAAALSQAFGIDIDLGN